LNTKKALLLRVILCAALLFSLALPIFAAEPESEMDDGKMTMIIEIVGIAAIVVVLIVLFVKNRSLIMRRPDADGAHAPLDENKVVDQIREKDESFHREDMKKQAEADLLTVLGALSARKADLLRPVETEALYSAHAKQIQEYQETRRTNHLEDIKVQAAELAEYTASRDNEQVILRVSAQMLDYTLDDASGNTLDGSKMVRCTHIYRMEYLRRTGDPESPWRLNRLTKWGRTL